MADDGGSILKYSLVGSTWVSNGSITAAGARGITASVSGSTVTLYFTYTGTSTKLGKYIDTAGYNAAPSAGSITDLVASAGTNKLIRGVAFAPQAAAGLPTLSVNDVSLNEGNSSTTSFTFTVSLSAPAGAGGVTFDIATADGTATQPSDYTAKSLTSQTIPAGSSTYTFTVLVNGDTTPEPNETFFVNVTNVTGATILDGQGLGTIVNDDAVTTSPTATGSANPNSLQAGASSLLTVNVTPGTNLPSTGLTVTANLTAVGGSATQQLFDDGTNGDVTAGDNIFSFFATVDSGTAPGPKSLPVAIGDAQSRTGSTSISLTVQSPPTAVGVKVSQVFGGGGNSGATFKNDFIEIFNQSSSPVDISQWSVQENSAGDTDTWDMTRLCPVGGTCILQPGHYFLIQESAGTNTAGVAADLPAPDATGIIAMGSTSGKVALVTNTTALAGGCPTGNGIVDMVGYGGNSATCFETTPVAALSNTTAAVRKSNGCIDTDNNTNDFLIIQAIPRNNASPANTFGGDVSLPSGVGAASPTAIDPAGSVLLTVAVTPATAPASTGIVVTGDLTSLGGSATQPFYDDGTHGDVASGNNTFSFQTAAGAYTSVGAHNIPVTITDTQGRTAHVLITLTIKAPTCGTERWKVKVGTDPDALSVDLLHPTRTTIAALRSLVAPGVLPEANRILPTETTVFVANGIIHVYKLEDDVDYHTVFQDPDGNTIVTEIPSPACDGTTSPFDSAIAAVRAKFDARFTATTSFQTADVSVQIKGVGFFDLVHGQTGVAPNGIELHPILDFTFTTATTTTLSASANPATYGQSVTITATVAGTAGTPTGTVSFFDAGSPLGSGNLDNTGKATFISSTLIAGPHVITASYDGDAANAQSKTAGSFALNISQATPAVTWSNPANITFGSALGNAQLNATASVPGAFVYTPAAGTVPPVGNSQTLSVVFTPSSSNYLAVAKSVLINVLPASGGGSPANLVPTSKLARVSGQVVATVTITNTGGTAAQNVTVTASRIGAVPTTTALPIALGSLPGGSSVQVVVSFPGTVGIAGAGSTFTLSGTFTGGTFGSTTRVALP